MIGTEKALADRPGRAPAGPDPRRERRSWSSRAKPTVAAAKALTRRLEDAIADLAARGHPPTPGSIEHRWQLCAARLGASPAALLGALYLLQLRTRDATAVDAGWAVSLVLLAVALRGARARATSRIAR